MLTIIDFAPHSIEMLRDEYEHLRLGFTEDEVSGWCSAADLENISAVNFTPSQKGADVLTVTLWTAMQRADAHASYTLEVA